MLDENLPTYHFKPSSEHPLNAVLYFTHNGSEPSAEYLLKRPDPASAANQYALALFDSLNGSVIYSEVLLKPEWTQPTLSAAEVRAGNGPPPQMPVTPDTFTMALYNPDQNVPVKLHPGSWGKSDAWEFEIPERSFRMPSASRIDQDADASAAAEVVPKLVFRWKRDSRLSKDMTCYMTGRSVAGKKNKDPDITVAFFRGNNDSILTIYEPNMARVEVEDRKGLELSLLMSAEVIRDLYLNPRHNPFNVVGLAAASGGRSRRNTSPKATSPVNGPAMSGALGNNRPSPAAQAYQSPTRAPGDAKARQQAEIEAETERLRAMVAEEERQAREREKHENERRESAERKRVQKILQQEEKERRKREAEVEKETERLRREYGMEGQEYHSPTSPQLPPRSTLGPPNLPPRPVSVGPMSPSQSQPQFASPPQQPQGGPNGKKRTGLGGLFQPYAGPAAASVSGFFGGRTEEDKRKRVQKKRSVHF